MSKSKSSVTVEAGKDQYDPMSELPEIGGGSSASTATIKQVAADDRAEVKVKPVLRPSAARKLAEQHGYRDKMGGVDVCRFLRSEGYPTPKRLIRVVPVVAAKAAKYPAQEFEAVDEPDALRMFFDRYKLSGDDQYKLVLHATIIEE